MDPASSLFIQEHTLLFFSVHPQVRKNHAVHYLQLYRIGKQLEKRMKDGIGEQEAKTINMFLLNLFFIKPYEPEQDFYEQYEERRAMAGQAGLK